MAEMKQLAKETAIYGVSSIVGKFLNWLLVPMYTYVLQNSGQYGIVTNLYAWTALVIVIITYGMETGFFRFASEHKDDKTLSDRVYSTTLCSLAVSSTLFAILIVLFRNDIVTLLDCGASASIIAMLGITVALDAFDSIPFAYLRYKKKPIKFAAFKLISIAINIFGNIFFLILCPKIMETSASWLVDWCYRPDFGIEYIFITNLISSFLCTLLLLPTVLEPKLDFDNVLLRKMLRYSLPILLLGIVGIMNQTVDKILFPIVYPDKVEAMQQLGIYGACFKVAMIMMMFTNAFRYAYEPFVFQKHGTSHCKESYSDAMKYFIITALLIFLAMVFYLDIIKFLLRSDYRIGMDIVPLILISYMFQGIVYNLALWYKLVDKTYWGAIISSLGFVIMFVIQLIFIPLYSYWACVWASVICYFVMMMVSYFVGQHYYPIDYQLKRIAMYVVVAALIWAAGTLLNIDNFFLRMAYRTLLLCIFCIVVMKKDLPLTSLPLYKKLTHRH
ncbi:MAG: oligosaccharide flippase family protein [Paludibacteraceae bacterium]|nr:oligosaccharide flippase family protein [Paludibacteraceae bacterium]